MGYTVSNANSAVTTYIVVLGAGRHKIHRLSLSHGPSHAIGRKKQSDKSWAVTDPEEVGLPTDIMRFSRRECQSPDGFTKDSLIPTNFDHSLPTRGMHSGRTV
jgi:hypothetical protein